MIQRRARSTGTLVTLERIAPDVDADGLPWVTICEDHGCFVGHRSRRVALSWLSHPEEWCGVCQEQPRQ